MQKLLERGEALLADGKLEEAESCFRTLVQSTPSSQAYNNLGVLTYQQGRSNEAADCFLNAIRLDTTNIDAVVNLCQVLQACGALHEVIGILQPLVRNHPKNLELKSWLDQALASQKNIDRTSPTKTGGPGVRPLRVLHGTCEVANQMYTISRGLKVLGIAAETLSYYPSYLNYRSDHVLDINAFGDNARAVSETRSYAKSVINEYDLFHFHFGSSLTLDYSDLPLLAKAGKKVVMQYWGSEVRRLSVARQFNRWVKTKVTDEQLIHDALRTVSTYVKHCIVSDYELFEYVKDYFKQVHVIPAALDLSQYSLQPSVRKPSRRPLIVHAPTSPEYKGTPQLVAAVKELETDYDFEFQLVENMPHDEAKKIYERADVIVDQLLTGSYGLFSIEAMAMGRPVIAWISEFMKGKYPLELPIISANPGTINERLRWALEHRDELVQIGIAGRKYVEMYHDHNKIAVQILNVYRQMMDEQ